MAAILCDFCGNSLSMKEGGVAECNVCGMRFSKERLMEMLQAATPAQNNAPPILSAVSTEQTSDGEPDLPSHSLCPACGNSLGFRDGQDYIFCTNCGRRATRADCTNDGSQYKTADADHMNRDTNGEYYADDLRQKDGSVNTDMDDFAIMTRLKDHVDKEQELFYEREELWLTVKESTKWPYIVIGVGAGLLIPRDSWYLNRSLFIMISAIAIGLCFYVFVKRSQRKSRLELLNDTLLNDYKDVAASYIPYELYHPLTIGKMLDWVSKGFSLYQAQDELKKECQLKHMNYETYAMTESLIERGKARRR